MKQDKHSKRTCLDRPNDTHLTLHSIRVRVFYKGNNVDLYVGHSVPIDKWDKGKQRVLANSKINGIKAVEINRVIAETENFIENYFDKCAFEGHTPSLSALKSQHKGIEVKREISEDDTLFRVYEQYLSQNNYKWSDSTSATERRTMEKLRAFNPKTSFESFTDTFIQGFINFLLQKMNNDKLKDYIKKLKAFGKWADAHHYPICTDLLKFSMNSYKGHEKQVRYLEEEEISTIWHLDLTSNPRLELCRDLFLFQCLTSLRVSDLIKLKASDVHNDGQLYSISLFTQKNKKRIDEYLLPEIAVQIYHKYSVHQYPRGKAFPIFYNSTYNKDLKEIGKMANLTGEWVDYQFVGKEHKEVTIPRTDLTTHVARRTFVSYALNHGISDDIVRLATSHSSVKEMTPYLNITKTGKEQMKQEFDKFK